MNESEINEHKIAISKAALAIACLAFLVNVSKSLAPAVQNKL